LSGSPRSFALAGRRKRCAAFGGLSTPNGGAVFWQEETSRRSILVEDHTVHEHVLAFAAVMDVNGDPDLDPCPDGIFIEGLDAVSTGGDGISRVYNLGDAAALTAGQTGSGFQMDTFGAVTRFVSTSTPPVATPPDNPTLELDGSSGQLITANDDWVASPQKQKIIDSGIPPTDSLESAIVATLREGDYTAIMAAPAEPQA
jgi:hypothetical protein